jgi:hypothetical protein
MPLSAKRVGNTCLSRARGLLKASTKSQLPPRTREDLRRLALVMGVVAVDAYMHWAILRRLGVIRRQGELPKALRQLQVPFEELAAIAESTVEGRRRRVDSRPWVQLKNAAQKRLLKMTIQSHQEVADAMAMVGVTDGWRTVAGFMNSPPEDVKQRLNRIVLRRNQIVHEGDIPRQARPRRVALNSILRADVADDLDFLKTLLTALHRVMRQVPGV